MSAIEKITVSEDVALITFRNSPADMKFVAHVFDLIAKRGINVDMISQTAPISARMSLSFTILEDDLGRLMEIFSALRVEYPDLKYDVAGGNCKISLYGEPMRSIPGVAAEVFEAVAESGTDVRIISTSEIDISLLIPKAEYAAARETFGKKFGIRF